MSRWSSEEDLDILEQIQLLNEEPKYEELVEYHNNKFNKTRTELAYKARVNKIAKENDIKLTPSIKWSEEDKEYIKSIVQSDPFNVNWSELAIKYNKSEQAIRNMYNNIVDSSEHIDLCISKCSKDKVLEILEINKKSCYKCSKVFYSYPKTWAENIYCDECYSDFNEEVIKRWEIIKDYSKEKGKSYCNICRINVEYNSQIGSRFHFDHLNMFEKTNSICSYIKDGTDIDIIKKEIEQCQVLCISCHEMVTQLERKSGFTRAKLNITRNCNSEEKIKMQKEYMEKYRKFTETMYEILREIQS